MSSSNASSPCNRTPTAVPPSSSAPATSRGRSVRTRTRSGRSSMSARSSEVAGRGQPALRHHEDLRAEPLDFVEHVTGDDHTTAFAPEASEQRNHVRALARIEARQRLVEDEHGRVVHDRLRDLHAWRIPFEYVGSLRVSAGSRSTVSSARAAAATGSGHRAASLPGDETPGRQRLEDGFLLRHQPDETRDTRVRSRVSRARERCPVTDGRARTACGASSTCRRRSARAARSLRRRCRS